MPPLRPTPAELEILDVLWARGASTVRDVHALLDRSRPTGYTTVLKLLQIMTDKGLVDRDETQRAHVYRPRGSREATQTRLIAELADRAFGGSAMALAMRAIGSRKATRAELAEMRRLLDDVEGRTR
jgi:predicted transcriptional regulator